MLVTAKNAEAIGIVPSRCANSWLRTIHPANRNKRKFVEWSVCDRSLQMRSFRRYGFAWVTGGFFIITLIGHWLFGWFAYVNEQAAHQQPVQISEYLVQMSRDTLENWQSEFLQLLWQVAGLALLLHVGSPQSKEGDDRMEAKIDAILLAVDKENGDRAIRDIDKLYQGRETDEGLKRRIAEEEEGGGKGERRKA
jgi:hypothetical protein